ncbi:MAG: pyridoxal phosphate-dependent aminotransferase [Oscillospiraceae bacterium]
MKSISKTAASIQPSATMTIDTRVRELRRAGISVSAFGGGEPDFVAADAVLEAGIQAIRDGNTKYTPAAGTPELRQAVAKRLSDDYGLAYKDSQIVITPGGKYAIYTALRVLLDPGDEVILPAPFWVSYGEQIRMAGGVPVIVHAPEESGFKITPAQLTAAVTEKTKLFILNNPGNPTGAVYDKNELTALAEVCRGKDLYVLADEMYAKLLYDGVEFTSFPTLSEDAFARTILINGASKAYAMTGWRIGYAAAPEHIARAMSSYLSQSTGCASSVSQAAAAAAFSGPQDHVEHMRAAYEERRNYLVRRIRAMDGLSCSVPKGAFYLLIRVDALYGRTLGGKRIESDMDFAQALLESARVAVTPGAAFGAPGYIRWCYAASLDELKTGADRLEQFLRA